MSGKKYHSCCSKTCLVKDSDIVYANIKKTYIYLVV